MIEFCVISSSISPTLTPSLKTTILSHVLSISSISDEINITALPSLASLIISFCISVFVPRGFRVLGSAVHGQPLRLGENDVVGKGGVYIGLDVLRVAP